MGVVNRRSFLQGVLGLIGVRAIPRLPGPVAPAAARPISGWWVDYAAYHVAQGYNLVWDRSDHVDLERFLA